MLLTFDALALLALALLLDAGIGDPDAVWRRLPHPVVLIGRLIGALEATANRPALGEGLRKSLGVLTVLVLLVLCGGLGLGLQLTLSALPGGWLVIALLASLLLAQKSLAQHVRAVAKGLGQSTEAGRHAVSMIVGRDPARLDEAGIARAAIESDAENFSDGLVAPAFWFAVAGLPGLLAYKALNTADSMIGHKSERYRAFGWAAARLDDLANYLPARLAGLLIALAAPFGGGTIVRAMRVMIRDGRRLASPNAGYPEAAMAGALDRALAGPRHYAGGISEGEWLNEEGSDKAGADDIVRAERITWGAWALLLVLTLVLAAVFY